VQLKGVAVLKQAPAWAGKWADQVGSLIPLPAPAIGLQKAYEEGLDAFNSWSKSVFGAPYYRAGTEQQDLMLSLAGNVVLGAVTGNVPLPSPPAPPAAATALFPIIALHTFQATYGIPEYSWRNQDNDGSVERPGGTAQWRAIAYDGDTQPLGNSLYDPNMTFPRGQDPNEGFGLEGQAPKGGYREYRPVSTLDPNHGTVLTAADVAALKAALAGEKEAAK
jgi:hypothetical protein